MLLLVSYEINLIRDAALNTQQYFNVNNLMVAMASSASDASLPIAT